MHIREAYKIAAETMKGYFSLAEAKPTVVVDPEKSMSYELDNGTLVSDIAHIDENDSTHIYIIGEEVGHFSHHNCNPEYFKRFCARDLNLANLKGVLEETAIAANFNECVGRYSGLVYVEKKHGVETARCINTILTMDDNKRSKAMIRCRRKPPDFVDHVIHAIGYRAGSKYYREHGDTKLNELAHVPFDEAVELMSKYIDKLPTNE